MPRVASSPRPRGRTRTEPLAHPKTKVSLTLDASAVKELQGHVGTRGLSAAVNSAVVAEVDRLRRAEALDKWLAELAEQDGAPSEKLVARFRSLWQSDR